MKAIADQAKSFGAVLRRLAQEGAVSASIGRLVAFSVARPWRVAGGGLLLALFAAIFAVSNFAMSSDTAGLISSDLPWRQREAAYDRAFPQNGDAIVAVVDGATPELAELGARRLSQALSAQPKLFPRVARPDGGPFFDQNGLLFLSTGEVQTATEKMISAQPFLGSLAADPSLRGLAASLSTAAKGISAGQSQLTDLDPALRQMGEVVAKVVDGRPAFFSWRSLLSGSPASRADLRRLIIITPRLNYQELQAGADASSVIRATGRRLGLTSAHGMRVRLTGQVPIQDEEFGSLAERAGLIGTVSLLFILGMLWLATRSARLIACIMITTFAGLSVTAAVGLLIFHRFNVISVAFIPLFVGLGVDFGIQFSVRFRAEQLAYSEAGPALAAAGRAIGWSLTLAAVAIAVGFMAFLPTSYVGVSQLGAVAGLGMLIALALNLSLLPALVKLARPAGHLREVGYAAMAPVDAFLVAHRREVLVIGAVVAGVGLLLIPFVRFDFNPLHLNDAKTESMSTLNDLLSDPDRSPNSIDVLTPNLAAADALARRLGRLPEVAQVATLSSFVPSDQPAKLALISDASTLMDLTLSPFDVAPEPADTEVVAQLRATAADLRGVAAGQAGQAGTHAARLAALFDRLAAAPPSTRQRAREAFIPGLNVMLDQLRSLLLAQPITYASLPRQLTETWVSADGRARVTALPRGNANDNKVLARFTRAVRRLAPEATGSPISIQEAGDAVAGAFAEAGLLSFMAITGLLFAVLRRPRDVIVTMTPIILTGLLTLGTCVAIGQPLNYANIIAFPLLFGIGVAFHIYFVMAWRAGGSHLLESSLARAVFFSALTTATGFGSLWASSHPGTASMGKLLMISLAWTLVTALIFQPALMGKPREP